MSYALGIICYGWHEAAAVLVNDGHVVAAAEEERFTRKKFDSSFPERAIAFCLKRAGIQSKDLAAIGYGFDPRRKLFQKVVHLARYFPGAIHLFMSRREILQRMNGFEKTLREKTNFTGPVYRLNHHLCHAASTFFSSPFAEATILTLDGVGDWEACWWGRGRGHQIEELGTIDWPLSLGHIYAAFTEFLGFQAFSDEYRVMGLAPYGKPTLTKEMAKLFWPTEKGYDVDFNYFGFSTGKIPRYSAKLVEKFGPPLRGNEIEIPESYRNLAASLQAQIEIVISHLARLAVAQTGVKKLCLAGGVAMNCVANGKLLSEKIADEIYVPSCASDAGVALGAAFLAHLKSTGGLRREVLSTALLGPDYSDAEIQAAICAHKLPFEKIENPSACAAELLSQGKVIAWFQGRMEFGQRALGARSILANPRRAEMKDIINAKVKFREPFRPFAPSVLEENANDFFHCTSKVPFMTEVYDVREEKKIIIPAVTHVDGTARLQTVSKSVNPLYWNLIKQFGERTGVPVVLNTSFNVKGQPIVNTPTEAMETFLKTDIDALICGNFLVAKNGVA